MPQIRVSRLRIEGWLEEVKVPRSCTDDLKMFVEKVMIMRIGDDDVDDEDDGGDEGVRGLWGVGDYEVPVERRPPIHQLASKKRWMADEMEERGDDDDGDVDDGGGDVDDDDGGPDGERRDDDNGDDDGVSHLFPICHHYQPFHCQFSIQKKLGNEREREKENRKERRERGLLGVCHLFPRVTRV